MTIQPHRLEEGEHELALDEYDALVSKPHLSRAGGDWHIGNNSVKVIERDEARGVIRVIVKRLELSDEGDEDSHDWE